MPEEDVLTTEYYDHGMPKGKVGYSCPPAGGCETFSVF